MATLTARVRQEKGKGVARKLRARGEIPAVAYGHGLEGRSLAVSAHDLELLLGGINPENTIIELRIEGESTARALIREIQQHPSRRQILHVDFFEIREGEKIHVSIPVRLNGTPRGVRDEGGVLQEVLRELSVECLPKDIPAAVEIDIEDLGLGDSVHVSDVSIPDVTVLNDAELVICSVTAPTVAALPEEEAAAEVEPELVGEVPEEGAGEAGAAESE